MLCDDDGVDMEVSAIARKKENTPQNWLTVRLTMAVCTAHYDGVCYVTNIVLVNFTYCVRCVSASLFIHLHLNGFG